MKYKCQYCSFQWEGTSYTFDQVREHEKTHFKKSISIRCKVCNTPNINKTSDNEDWECKTCGNLLGDEGRVINKQK